MKNIIWILMLFPLLVCSQVRIKGTSQIRVLEEGAVRVTGNTEVATAAQLSILGDYTTNGNLVNNGSASNITVQSTAAQTGSLIVDGTATGNVRVERYLTASTWHFLAASVNGANTGDFYFNGSPNVWLSYFDEPNSTWPYITGTSENLPLGMGYKMWVGESKSAINTEMEGSIRTADLLVNLTTSGSGWNLIGNPYTSELDVRLGEWGANTSGSFWVWDSLYNGGDYRFSNGLGEGSLNGIIPISQSFFVYAESSGNFTIPKDAQTHVDTAEFYKKSSSNDFVRIQLDVQNKGNTLFVGFPSIGTSGIDRLADTYKIYSSTETPQLYGIQDGEKLCILADAPLYDLERVIPIYIDQWVNGEYTMSIDEQGAEYFEVYLEDLMLNKIENLSLAKEYQFHANSGDENDRFLLHFSRKPQSVEQIEQEEKDILIYSNENVVYIKPLVESYKESGVLNIYDLKGQLVYSTQVPLNQISRISLDKNVANYLVQLNTKEATYTQKVFIH